MNKLKVIDHNGAPVVDSREVAEMVGKEHKHLLRDIRGYIDAMSKSTGPNFGPSDFFIESNYKDSTRRELPCYLLTKKGCDMVANKMTGEKGVLFTAAYVTAFERMRERIESGKALLRAAETDNAVLERAANKRATAMLLNAKNRTAAFLRDLYTQAGVKPEYQALTLSDFYSVDGVALPRIALQGTKVTYDKGTIAEMLGVYSKASGGKRPHAQAIGAILPLLDISDEEREAVPYSRNGHDGTDYQYTQSVVDKLRCWFEEHGWPDTINADGKKYGVIY